MDRRPDIGFYHPDRGIEVQGPANPGYTSDWRQLESDVHLMLALSSLQLNESKADVLEIEQSSLYLRRRNQLLRRN